MAHRRRDTVEEQLIVWVTIFLLQYDFALELTAAMITCIYTEYLFSQNLIMEGAHGSLYSLIIYTLR